MSDLNENSTTHIKLFIPGPTDVRPEILAAQAQPMVGHRMPEAIALYARIEEKIRQVFLTEKRVFINASSGSGLQEAAVRNCVQTKVLNCINGAFSDRWHKVSKANGKETAILTAEWGQPILPEAVVAALSADNFDAVTIVHNETSTGVINPIAEIAAAIRQMAGGSEIMILVDSVSGLSGARMEFDAWDLDVVLTSSQKAFCLPPGLAFCAVSDRALARAETVANRGWYFDFLLLEKYQIKNQTPATPAISLMYALDKQLDYMLAETMEGRFARHLEMRDHTIRWAEKQGFTLYAAEGYRSPTVTCINNNLNIDISALNQFLRQNGMILSNGYGTLKGSNFRIAHMGDTQIEDLNQLFKLVEQFIN